jgi:NADH-quinone oxidoreductase subunit J
MSLSVVLFTVLALATGGSAVAVVLTSNIVRAAVWLLFTLAGVSGLYFLLGADFVGASQLIVYVGGTLVLVVFGVMLTSQGPFLQIRTRPAEWVVAGALGLSLLGLLVAATTRGFGSAGPESAPPPSVGPGQLGAAFAGVKEATPPAKLTGLPEGAVPRERSRIAYLLPFEIVSVHLLVVLIGAAYLARAKRRTAPAPAVGRVLTPSPLAGEGWGGGYATPSTTNHQPGAAHAP